VELVEKWVELEIRGLEKDKRLLGVVSVDRKTVMGGSSEGV